MKKIGFDIDDVLSATAAGFAAFSNERWGGGYRPEDYTEAWAEFWNVTLEEALKRSEEYHDSDAVFSYAHFPEALPVLQHLKRHFELITITSRRSVLRPLTDSWLAQCYPGVFAETHYAGIWDPGNNSTVEHRLTQTKAELARELGVDYLVDDQLKHCAGAAAVGIQALLFGDSRHFRDVELPDGVVRVADWHALGEYFDAQS